MTTTLTFVDGTTRVVADSTAGLIRGLDMDGDLVIETDGGRLIPLTPCCDSTGKGADSPTGVVCRTCREVVAVKFGGPAAVHTRVSLVREVPMPEWEDDVLTVGEVVRLADDGRPRRRAPVLYRVAAVQGPAGSERYSLEACRGGRGIAAYRSSLVRLSGPADLARAAAEEEQAATVGPLTLGSIVRFAKPKTDAERGLFVVVVASTKATFNVAPLGGSEKGTYYRGVTTAHLVPVPRSAIAVIEEGDL